MPTTTFNFRPSSQAQLHLINNLLAERNMSDIPEEVRVLVGRASSGNMSIRDTSVLIDRLMATPRASQSHRTNASVMQRSADSEIVNSPVVTNRAGRMLLAGGIEATVTLPNGEHMTFRINTRSPHGRGWHNCGPTEQGARTTIKCLGRNVGWVNVTEDGWVLTFRTRNVRVKDALRALFGYAAGARDESGQMGAYRIQESSRCGRCLRTLTDPVSIERGIGPECFGRTTGSHHAAIDREAQRALSSGSIVTDLLDDSPVPVQERRTLNSAELAERSAVIERALAPTPYDPEDGDCGGCQNDEHCGHCPCCTEQRPSITQVAMTLSTQPQLDSETRRARDIIAEALDAYGEREAAFALQVFDRLADRA